MLTDSVKATIREALERYRWRPSKWNWNNWDYEHRDKVNEALAAIAQLAEASSWEPVPDGEYKYPNWDDKYTVVMSVSSGGSTLGEWQDIEQWIEGYEHVDEVALPKQYRLCQRTNAPTAQASAQEVEDE